MRRSEHGRVTAFTDGVMAVAITLLVLNLEVPDVANDDVVESLEELLPSLGAYALSFALVGRFWVVHHRLFEALREVDGPLMALNLLFLSLIALMPFSTDLMDAYSSVATPVAVFGATIGLAALVEWLMGGYAIRRELLHGDERGHDLPRNRPVALGFAAVFLLTVPVAYVSTTAAHIIWVGTFALRYPLRRLAGRGLSTSP